MERDSEPKQSPMTFQLISSLLPQTKALSTALRNISKAACESNNALINRMLLVGQQGTLQLIEDLLSHLLHLIELRNLTLPILSVVSKVIFFFKVYSQQCRENKQPTLFMPDALCPVLDILVLLRNKDKEQALRIMQTTFSLIDFEMLEHADFALYIRLFAICFDCWGGDVILQNIATSALYSLTEIVFTHGSTADAHTILLHFLQYLFKEKKFPWLKTSEITALVWELCIVGVKHCSQDKIQAMSSRLDLIQLITIMYTTSLQHSFRQQKHKPQIKRKNEKNVIKKNQKNNALRGVLNDFIRFYKAFIYLSVQLALKTNESIIAFKMIPEMERNEKTYLLLEGVSILLRSKHRLPLEQDSAAVFIDVWTKVSEELCFNCNTNHVVWHGNGLYLDKLCGDPTKITDSDYIRLTTNLFVTLRKLLQADLLIKPNSNQIIDPKEGDSKQVDTNVDSKQVNANSENKQINVKEVDLTMILSKSNGQKKQKEDPDVRRRWQYLIKNVVRIIRYLTSLDLNESENEQPIRKLLTELQHWFLLCDSSKGRNLITEQLLLTSSLMNTKMQAIKVAQCVQIGANLIYGYYELLDTLGLAHLLKMMAAIKVACDFGKGFDQLNEVFTLMDKLYSEQRLIYSQQAFSKTIHSFLQCANSLQSDLSLADNQKQYTLKMMDFLLQKLTVVVQYNSQYLAKEWNLLACFWISLCSTKISEVKERTLNYLSATIEAVLTQKTSLTQETILSVYLQLSKMGSANTIVVRHLRQLIQFVRTEQAIILIFTIIRNLNRENVELSEVSDLQQALVKEGLFKVKKVSNLDFILDAIAVTSADKTEEYRLIHLFWCVSDHLRTLNDSSLVPVWKHLFLRLSHLATHSAQVQTKQSCIHTFTQIVAESFQHFTAEFVLSFMLQSYCSVLYFMLGLVGKSSQELQFKIEMIKIATKNFFKIQKKIYTTYQTVAIDIINTIFKDIEQHFINNQNLTIEEHVQFLWFLRKGIEFVKKEQKNIICRILTQIEKQSEKMNTNSNTWVKKYLPLIEELKQELKDEKNVDS